MALPSLLKMRGSAFEVCLVPSEMLEPAMGQNTMGKKPKTQLPISKRLVTRGRVNTGSR